jgi:hypothetical protein
MSRSFDFGKDHLKTEATNAVDPSWSAWLAGGATGSE